MSKKYTLKFHEGGSLELVGGKGLSLAVLSKVPGISVPNGFNITTEAYENLISQGNLRKEIELLDKLSGSSEREKIFSLGSKIRKKITSARVPYEIEKIVKDCYEELCEEFHSFNLSVAVRSSATVEDSPNASFAGQMESYLNQRGLKDLLSSMKNCFGSLFSERAIDYKNKNKISHSKTKLAVSVLRMIEAYGAGVGFNVDISSGKPGITIEANYGLGESVVQGRISPDYWLLDPKGERVLLGKLGNKKEKVIYSDGSGIRYVDVDLEDQEKFVFSNGLVKKIARLINEIGIYYKNRFGYEYVDTEFVVDSDEKEYFVQARPETVLCKHNGNINYLDFGRNNSKRPLLKGGEAACYNVGAGNAKVVVLYDPSRNKKPEKGFFMQDNPDEKDIFRLSKYVETGDILVATKTVPSFETAMQKVNGIVTEEGGLSCHAAIIAREFGIPCIVGMTGIIDLLSQREGQTITIDPLKKAVYLGDLKFFEKKGNLTDILLESYTDEALKESIEKVTYEIARPEDKGKWFGRPIHEIGNLQIELYEKALDRLGKRLGLRLKRKVENKVLKTPVNDNELIVARLFEHELSGLEKLFYERTEVVKEFRELTENFSLEKITDLEDVYTRLIEHFHMRWLFRQVLEIMQKQEMFRFPIEARPYIDFLYLNQISRSEFQKVKRKEYGELLNACRKRNNLFEQYLNGELLEKLSNVDPKLKEQIEYYASKYPRTDSVDFRLPPPIETIVEDLRRDVRNYRPSFSGIYSFDLPEKFDEKLLRIIKLNAEQTIQKEVEPYIQIGGQYKVREVLFEIGQKAYSRDLLENPSEVFEVSCAKLIEVSNKII